MKETKHTVLIVDDTPANLSLLANLLKHDYSIKVANNGQKCLDIAFQTPPDIILLDVMMPIVDGWETCKQLKANELTKHTPIIFLTAKNSIEDEEYGFELGAVDFISKPISPSIVMARIKTHLQNKEYQDFLLNQADWLRDEVDKKLLQINKLQDASMMVMVSLAEFRDECTGWHIKRTQEFVGILAKKLSKLEKFENILTEKYIDDLMKSAPLHDIGKVAIPDNILLKPAKLSDEEMEIMKTHAQKGANMLKQAQNYIETDVNFLSTAIEIAQSHHEKFDGTGYPYGLKDCDIPISARLMAIADVYDALTNARPYKKAFSHEEACNIILTSSGTHFDPDIVLAFKEHHEEFKYVANKWNDGEFKKKDTNE